MKKPRLRAVLLATPVALSIVLAYNVLLFTVKSFRTLKNPGVYLLIITLFFTSTSLAAAPRAELSHPYQAPMVIYPDMKVREIVLSMARIEFGANQVVSLDKLLMRESGFNPKALNPTSGACGVFQSLPCRKMLSMDLQDQIQFGFDYIKNRYGTPNNAWAHEVKDGWY